MSAINSSRHLQVLLRRVRKSSLASPLIFNKFEAVQCCSSRQAPASTLWTSAITRNLEQSLLADANASKPSAVLHPTLKPAPLNIVAAKGTNVVFSNGKMMEDTTCGAAVACLGYDNERVRTAMIKQMDNFSYSNSMFYGHEIGEQLAAELIKGTNGEMSKVYLMCSGAEAMEAAMKMARQYYMELNPKQPQRINFIGREGSYHGSTLGSLSMGGHVARRKLFEGMLLDNVHRVSAANEYRGKADGQTTEDYVQQLADELDRKFQEVGPDTVAAFVCESLVGATLGTIPAPAGYFKAMKKVCDKYGALLILDEVMSGMGRCGSLHEWEQEGVVPDIQTIAKGLAGGFAPMAGMFINHRVSSALMAGTGVFSHAHTYQGHPVGCAAALEVQRIVREDNLVDNVRENGQYLGKLLHEQLDDHPHVGNIRGRGFFWSLEFVAYKEKKEPFPPSAGIAKKVHLAALNDVGISLYPGMGTKDGVTGDHVWIAPAYTSTKHDIERIVSKVKESVTLALG
ncbi:adenosylmethionine-8-amino-7-oxononanoate aminotransferase [Fusarium torulosum]|uniref:Adenosylmethionine-8-amino-7-oxononanoate aminotransferase n=1 Tax=Fusarium torulosum TaxID=33205 RepID=A0AAE8SLP6_9HYPO|nr:adenosylmethionine-8-amino-7-oxononanoate aminotransferase [Fusarium torulosum]